MPFHIWEASFSWPMFSRPNLVILPPNSLVEVARWMVYAESCTASGRINAEFLAIGRRRGTCPVGTAPRKRCSRCPGALRLPRGLKSRSSAVAGLYTFVRVLVGASKGACLIRSPHKSTLRRGKAPHMIMFIVIILGGKAPPIVDKWSTPDIREASSHSTQPIASGEGRTGYGKAPTRAK